MAGIVETVDLEAEKGREPFYERARGRNLAPLWRVLGGLVTDEPRSSCVPAFWAYGDVRPYLMEACGLISTQESERRVLVLENPGLPGQSRITPSLFTGYQIILPGEIAPTHRHVASALRFVLEGKNAYTAVAGERTMMEPGDFVITPSWTWHDHGNESDGPMVWIDGLDMHIVNLLSASFRSSYPHDTQPITRPPGSAAAVAGCNLLPVDFESGSQTSPIFNYPYRATREALAGFSRTRDPDVCHGYKMHYINPVTGSAAIPTITTAMQLLPGGFATQPYRSTAGTIFSVVEGTGRVTIGEQRFEFGPRDLFVTPSWFPMVLSARTEVVLFSYSDRIVQEKLDLFRELRGNG
jgi:gentisate 1,2-dioxygenase